MLALLLGSFDITPLYTTDNDGKQVPITDVRTNLDVHGVGNKTPIGPMRADARPGLGAFQFGGSGVTVKMTRRVR